MATTYSLLLGLCLNGLLAGAQSLAVTRYLSTTYQAASLEQASQQLKASNVLVASQVVEYKAGQSVELLPGFSTRMGLVFLAHTGTVTLPPAWEAQSESTGGLQVKVLGNPVEGKSVEVEIRGVAGQPLELTLLDLQGKPVGHQRLEQAASVERVSLPVGTSKGILHLQVSTVNQRQHIKLLTP